jgi:hypothetical protein
VSLAEAKSCVTKSCTETELSRVEANDGGVVEQEGDTSASTLIALTRRAVRKYVDEKIQTGR